MAHTLAQHAHFNFGPNPIQSIFFKTHFTKSSQIQPILHDSPFEVNFIYNPHIWKNNVHKLEDKNHIYTAQNHIHTAHTSHGNASYHPKMLRITRLNRNPTNGCSVANNKVKTSLFNIEQQQHFLHENYKTNTKLRNSNRQSDSCRSKVSDSLLKENRTT